MEDILVPFIVFAAITAWVLGPRWLRMRHEIAKEKINKLAAFSPEKEGEVKKLQERVENLETLICRLDSEINLQLEKSLGVGRVGTPSVSASGNSQMPTAFMNVVSALEGRYQILKELGRGGMGIVYQAHDKQLKDQVAIKILSPLLSNDPEALERMKREVSAARRITHPNVIRIHDIAETGGLHYVSMEYFQGSNLKEFIKTNAPLSMGMASNIAYQICDGLEEAHRQGVVHRDLKSQNIIVGASNHVKIIDFGLAQSSHLAGMTATGLIMGTPEYMAPEQVSGKRVDERADIYSLGIILYELFTGRVPFSGDSAIAVGFKQLKEDPPKPTEINPQLPDSIENVILRALEKDPMRRYSSVGALKADLQEAMSQPVRATKTPAKDRKAEEQRIKI
jgi:eukaryotic-like serine/threonine-protein kinase